MLVASAVIGFVLQQSALKTGVLASAIASGNAISLFAGVILGAVVNGETLRHGGGHLPSAIIGLALAVVGIVVLARAEGPTAGDGTRRRRVRYGADAMVVTPTGAVSGRKPKVRHRAGNRDIL